MPGNGPSNRRPHYRNLGDINDEAEGVFRKAGITADCKFVPYLGPFGGGTNVCDVAGDERGAEFGAELIARPGGIDIYQTEAAGSAALVAERAREQEAIAKYNRELNAMAPPVLIATHSPETVEYHPAIQVDPPAVYPRIPPPAPFEAPPPPGTWQFDAQPVVINPNLGPAPAHTATPLLSVGPTSMIAVIDDLTGGAPIAETLQQTVGGIPIWMLIAAAAAAAYLMLGDKR